MAFGASGAAFLFTAVRRDLLDILVKNGAPPPYELGKAPSTTVATETFGVNVYSKTGMKAPKK